MKTDRQSPRFTTPACFLKRETGRDLVWLFTAYTTKHFKLRCFAIR